MKLSLARWDDHQGKSVGYWIIREIPGFMLERGYQGEWRVRCGSVEHLSQSNPFTRAWGMNWSPSFELYENLKATGKGYPTRREVLSALEIELGGRQNPEALREVLCD